MLEYTPTTGYVPPEERDTAYALFNETFVCSIRQFQMRTLEDVRENGVMTSGDRDIDRIDAERLIDVGLTCMKIADRIKAGFEVRVRSPEDCRRIHDIVRLHLVACARNIQQSFSSPNPKVLDDLQVLDKMAEKFYPAATGFFKEPDNRLLFGLAGPTKIVGGIDVRKKEPTPSKTVRAYAPMSEFLKDVNTAAPPISAKGNRSSFSSKFKNTR